MLFEFLFVISIITLVMCILVTLFAKPGEDTDAVVFLGLISLLSCLVSVTSLDFQVSSDDGYSSCHEFVLENRDFDLVSGGAVSFSEVPEVCKLQFERFYLDGKFGDLSFAWEKFKDYKLKQIT